MRVVFIGTGEIGVPTLESLLNANEHELVGIVTGPDKPVGREQRIEPSPIKAAVAGKNIGTVQPARIKDRQAIDRIRALNPDLIAVMAYGQILPRDVLEIPKIACVNLHASLLPRWRGASPIQAAIATGDRETGITVMYMNEGLDTGDVLLQRKIDISPNETGRSLHDRLAQIAPDALLEALRLLASGSAPRIPQNDAIATYAPKLTREGGRIDWSEPAEVIERKIRAYNPWPGASMKLDNRSLKIFSAAIVDFAGKPGEVLGADKEFVVAAGEGALSLLELQLEGGKRMRAAEFLRGQRWIAISGRDAQ
ncbi:MAG TPA: methionyl-tRNA formyltransferase [Chthoniobacterales bacterium]|nr:methionyl-tRNA formyltransferase [Chthoniobacterales bacterium]